MQDITRCYYHVVSICLFDFLRTQRETVYTSSSIRWTTLFRDGSNGVASELDYEALSNIAHRSACNATNVHAVCDTLAQVSQFLCRHLGKVQVDKLQVSDSGEVSAAGEVSGTLHPGEEAQVEVGGPALHYLRSLPLLQDVITDWEPALTCTPG